MNPAQLLDPKGFVKAKSKKRTPNYGPQQTRKQPTTTSSSPDKAKVNLPSYDPKALLNPKSAGKPVAMTSKSEPEHDLEAQGRNFATFYERHHNVKNREVQPATKRKSKELEDDSDDNSKRQQTAVNAGKGGVISEHLKKEREAIAKTNGAIPASEPIDLTGDNDNDDDVLIVQASTREVCLGMLNARAQASLVPAVGKAEKSLKDYWPITRIGLQRKPHSKDVVVELTDAKRAIFARLEQPVAAALCPLMDGASLSHVRFKAFLMARPKKKDDVVGKYISEALAIMIVVYSPRDKADQIGKWLSQRQQWLVAPPAVDSGKEYYNPQTKIKDHRPAHVANGVKKPVSIEGASYSMRTVEEKQQLVDKLFDSLVKHEDLAEMEADKQVIKTKLLKHQKQALQFMVDHEDAESTATRSKLWELKTNRGREEWHSVITSQIMHKKPEPTLGGILADMMGLGKTLSILALIGSTKSQAKEFTKSPLPEELVPVEGAVIKSTLLVCPTSVLTNWEEQLKQHVHPNGLKLIRYHGPTRTQDLQELGKHNIILTSYGTLANEFEAKNNRRSALFKVKFFRVVLDEGHTIRNQSTRAYKAACALHAQRRWAVTGTPVQNRLDDLGALITFLRVQPFNQGHVWAQHIMAPFKTGNTDVIKDLRLLVDSLTLRRMKDTINLPDRTESIVRLSFTDEERLLYNAFSAQSNTKLQTLTRQTGTIRGKGYSHVLKALLRLRMICCHGKELVREEDMEDIKGYDSSLPIDCGDVLEDDLQSFIKEKDAYETFEMIQSGEVNQCIHCNETITVPSSEDDEEEYHSGRSEDPSEDVFGYMTPCYHLLHPQCKLAYVKGLTLTADGYYTCRIDGDYVRSEYFALTQEGLAEYLEEKDQKSHLRKKVNFNVDTYQPSTKVNELVRQLKISAAETAELPEGEPPIRSVVFTEWTSYLDLIEMGLQVAEINFVRLDGSMSVSERGKVLHKFKTDPAVHVLIVSIKAGGQGLNYTAANMVYLMEPQFNPGVEQQAVDRVHRLGQTRDVDITHFIMTDTIEDGILSIQDKKIKLANLSLERKRTGPEDAKARIEELRALFK